MRHRLSPRPTMRAVQQDELHVSVYVRTGDRFGSRPLYKEILDRAKAAGLSDASAAIGLQGFGQTAKLRPAALTRRTGSEPVLIEITGSPARVRAFLPVLHQLLDSGLVALKTVVVTRMVADIPDIAAATAAQ